MKQLFILYLILIVKFYNVAVSIHLLWMFLSRSIIFYICFFTSFCRSLDPFNYLRIWHDNTGQYASASWFLIGMKKPDEWELQEERDERIRSEYHDLIERFQEKNGRTFRGTQPRRKALFCLEKYNKNYIVDLDHNEWTDCSITERNSCLTETCSSSSQHTYEI